MFYHKERNLRVVVHGDDFTILGFEGDLDRFIQDIIIEPTKIFQIDNLKIIQNGLFFIKKLY